MKVGRLRCILIFDIFLLSSWGDKSRNLEVDCCIGFVFVLKFRN